MFDDGPQGQRRYLNMTKVPVFDSAGRIDYLLCITEDVTERQAALEAAEDEWLRLELLRDEVEG